MAPNSRLTVVVATHGEEFYGNLLKSLPDDVGVIVQRNGMYDSGKYVQAAESLDHDDVALFIQDSTVINDQSVLYAGLRDAQDGSVVPLWSFSGGEMPKEQEDWIAAYVGRRRSGSDLGIAGPMFFSKAGNLHRVVAQYGSPNLLDKGHQMAMERAWPMMFKDVGIAVRTALLHPEWTRCHQDVLAGKQAITKITPHRA